MIALRLVAGLRSGGSGVARRRHCLVLVLSICLLIAATLPSVVVMTEWWKSSLLEPRDGEPLHPSVFRGDATSNFIGSPKPESEGTLSTTTHSASPPSAVRGGVEAMDTMPHPSCVGLGVVGETLLGERRFWSQVAAVAARSPTKRRTAASPAVRMTPVPLRSPNHEYWREYAKPELFCYKHGGHTPGLPRRSGVLAFDSLHRDHIRSMRHVILHNVTFWNGDFYMPRGNGAVGEGEDGASMVHFAAYFPMVGGNWPQPVFDSLPVERYDPFNPPWLRKDHAEPTNERMSRVVRVRAAYLQPPTDYGSVYHSTVETILPMFHSLMRYKASSSDRGMLPAISVITSRPRHTRYAFREKGCARAFQSCMKTVWGAMALAISVASTDAERRTLLRTVPGQSALATSPHAVREGAAFVYGLHRDHQQWRHVTSSTEYPFSPNADRHTVLQFDELIVGNPTHCEPLWGGDPHMAELVAQQHSIRGNRSNRHRLEGDVDPRATSSAALSSFWAAYRDCQRTLRAFRDFIVSHSLTGSAVTALSSIDAGPRHPIHVVFTTRKGEWARELLDEDEIVSMLRRHIQDKYPRVVSSVRTVKFGGSVAEQLTSAAQLDVERTTIFIGNHGANLVNSLFLRPNAAVITLSLRNPGFYPFSVFPAWLHVRDLVVEQMCNRRLNKGKCRWMDGNNNDMFVSATQRTTLLELLDDVIDQQEQDPRSHS